MINFTYEFTKEYPNPSEEGFWEIAFIKNGQHVNLVYCENSAESVLKTIQRNLIQLTNKEI